MFEIHVDSISYVKSNTVLLKELSCTIKAGTINVITGNPRSGKTLLCNILTGKLEASRGIIDVNGSIQSLSLFAELTYPVSQPVGLTVQEWITLWAENWRIHPSKLLSSIIDVYPIAGLMLNRMCDSLSSTEFYCLEIARYILAPVACLVFDDAHLPIDKESQDVQIKVWEQFKSNGRAVLLLMPIDYVSKYPIINSLNGDKTQTNVKLSNGKVKLQLDGPSYRLRRFIQDGSINIRFITTDVIEIEPDSDIDEVLTTINNLGIKWSNLE